MKILPPGTSQRKIIEQLCIPKIMIAKFLKYEIILCINFNSNKICGQKCKREGKYPSVDKASKL